MFKEILQGSVQKLTLSFDFNNRVSKTASASRIFYFGWILAPPYCINYTASGTTKHCKQNSARKMDRRSSKILTQKIKATYFLIWSIQILLLWCVRKILGPNLLSSQKIYLLSNQAKNERNYPCHLYSNNTEF